jgi:ribosome biogenesis GTPase
MESLYIIAVIDESRMIGRVVELLGPKARIFTGRGFISAVITGKLKYGDKDVSPIAVGDFVKYSLKTGEDAAVESIEARKSVLSKPAVEREGLLQIVASNIDRLIIVTSVMNPRFKPGLVDRFLVTAFKEDLKAVVVLNKIDLKSPESLADYFDAWRSIGCETIFTSALTGEGIESFEKSLVHGTSVIAGHSGVGKSSLLNRVVPGLNLRIGEVSSSSDRGIHTTSKVSLFQVFPDGWVADTPGLKVFGLTGVERGNLRLYYPEFERCESDCQFADCAHVKEPSCAVKRSVESNDGLVAPFRYDSYLRIYGSLEG